MFAMGEPPNSTRLRGRCKRLVPVSDFAWRRKARGQRDNLLPRGLTQQQLAGRARRDRHLRRGLCKLSPSANLSSSGIRTRGG